MNNKRLSKIGFSCEETRRDTCNPNRQSRHSLNEKLWQINLFTGNFFKTSNTVRISIFYALRPGVFLPGVLQASTPLRHIFWYRFHLGETDAKIYPIESVPKPSQRNPNTLNDTLIRINESEN